MVKKVVRTLPKSRGNPVTVKVEKGEVKTLKCAYCNGTGKDPWGIPSPLSNCQVCKGKGTIQIEKPDETCPVCRGSGNQRNKRLTCLACGGKGVIHIKKGMKECPKCGGTGVTGSTGLRNYCLKCKGKGLIPA
ncbi:MAG: Chaperone protein DnaJ [Candidatus Scalindua rubra]|uniref:Chaperone protein DnaJ n=1 Tax=Candidatus Scalindua rubra TaxID=1872076 RepID=A0A1E3XD52_9BACT|nr:MAG: Chaperone protein DnaJ [Candidatus Scalindua rubra]